MGIAPTPVSLAPYYNIICKSQKLKTYPNSLQLVEYQPELIGSVELTGIYFVVWRWENRIHCNLKGIFYEIGDELLTPFSLLERGVLPDPTQENSAALSNNKPHLENLKSE